MLLKLAALGTLGYVGYRYYKAKAPGVAGEDGIRLAGGPLSSAATLQHTPDLPSS
ncbi:MAG: hypothetical protein ABW184_17340 [Sphingobium sp.]